MVPNGCDIYLGDDKFWGFGPADGSWRRVQSLPEWMEIVRGFSGGASETGERLYLFVGLQ